MGDVAQGHGCVNYLRLPRALPGCDGDEMLIQRFLMEQRAKLTDALAPCESPMERTFAYALLAAGDKDGSFLDLVPPNLRASSDLLARGRGGELYAQYAIVIRGREARLDFALILGDQRLAIEIDGHDYHSTKPQIAADNARHRALGAMGWRAMRFSGSEVYNGAAALADEVFASLGFKPGVATAIPSAQASPSGPARGASAQNEDLKALLRAAEQRGDVQEVDRLLGLISERAKARLAQKSMAG